MSKQPITFPYLLPPVGALARELTSRRRGVDRKGEGISIGWTPGTGEWDVSFGCDWSHPVHAGVLLHPKVDPVLQAPRIREQLAEQAIRAGLASAEQIADADRRSMGPPLKERRKVNPGLLVLVLLVLIGTLILSQVACAPTSHQVRAPTNRELLDQLTRQNLYNAIYNR